MCLCLLAVIFRRSLDIRGSSNVRTRIKQTLKECTEGKFQTLVSSAALSAKSFMSRKRVVTAIPNWAKIFSNLVCRGKTQMATCCTCDREKGSVLMLDNFDEKSGEKVNDGL